MEGALKLKFARALCFSLKINFIWKLTELGNYNNHVLDTYWVFQILEMSDRDRDMKLKESPCY